MKRMTIVASLMTILFLASGCGSTVKTNEASSGAAASTASATKAASGAQNVKKIIIGTGTQFPNICFIDDKGSLTGYDVELIKEIDKRLPEYEFEFKTMEFKNLLLSLETNKIDLIAHQMEVNEERKTKFLFNDESYNVFPLKIAVKKDNNDVKSIEDLRGKKLITGSTSNGALLVDKWNKANGKDKPIDIVYTGAGESSVEQIKSGRADATITTQFSVDYQNKATDAQLKTVGDTLSNSKVFFMLRKDETDLKKSVDETLKQIKADGTLSKLSTQWLGSDYTVEK
jgi:L-cystine transport system substrate-binding protein